MEEYGKLEDSTGSTSKAFGILAKSLFSPINLLSIGIAIPPKLIEKIGEWTGATKNSAQAQKEAAEQGQRYNDVIKKQLDVLGTSTEAATISKKESGLPKTKSMRQKTLGRPF